jgi:hypothetical protein
MCKCSDRGCAAHIGIAQCDGPHEYTVYRVDMDDRTGTPMCEWCMEDAHASGVFKAEAV